MLSSFNLNDAKYIKKDLVELELIQHKPICSEQTAYRGVLGKPISLLTIYLTPIYLELSVHLLSLELSLPAIAYIGVSALLSFRVR